MTCVKETLCTSCVHREVCSKKEEYLTAQTAVDDILVGLGDKGVIHLRDIKWIRPVQLQCTYYMSNGYGTLRGVSVLDCDHTISDSTMNKCGTGDNVFGYIVGGDTIAR